MSARGAPVRVIIGVALVVGVVSGCAAAPARSGLIAKLEQRNALSTAQATCVADGLYDGMPDARPPVRPLTTGELREAAKADNAGKVPADALEIIRTVIGHCVPEGAPAPQGS